MAATERRGCCVLVSSGDANRPFKVLGLVVGFASKSGNIDVEAVYEKALKRLTESAKELGASGLLFVNFQNRVAVAPHPCGGTQQAFEVFAWGTAVQLVKTSG
jgi:uncharacterized protein YbjQ (UPF0145 family)